MEGVYYEKMFLSLVRFALSRLILAIVAHLDRNLPNGCQNGISQWRTR